MPVGKFAVAIGRIVLQQGGNEIVGRTPVQVMVLRAQQQKQVVSTDVGNPAFLADPQP